MSVLGTPEVDNRGIAIPPSNVRSNNPQLDNYLTSLFSVF